MTSENRRRAAAAELSASEDSLTVARILSEKGFHRESVSRSYYAAFYLTRALLLWEGVQARTHVGVNQQFNLLFVHSGKIDKKFSRLLSLLQAEREGADYQTEVVFTADDSARWLAEVVEFDQAVRALTSGAL